MTCLGCSCERPAAAGPIGRVLLSTDVGHTRAALLGVLRGTGDQVTELAPGVLEVRTTDGTGLLDSMAGALTSVEAGEVRAVVLGEEHGDRLVAAAMRAPTLATLAARARHVDLLPLFDDEHGSFRSVYQPIVALGGTAASGVVGYEALLRARSSVAELMPDALFGAAEQAGWLHVLDRIGRTTALRGAAGWLGSALLFVNFLPTTIYRPEVCLATTERAAKEAGLRLDQLVFEVTESEQVTDLDHLERVFAYYRERGCKVALDDLGAGYSSLNMLVRLQPDIVKLDKEIVQQLPSPVSQAVVAAVVEMTHAYGGQVLAECVETADQASAAHELGVDLGQGWFFGRPEERLVPTPAATAAARSVSAAGGSGLAQRAATDFTGNDRAVALLEEPAPLSGTSRVPVDVEALLTRGIQLSGTGISIADARKPDMPLVYVNDAFERMTGYLSSEVLGRNCRFLQGPQELRDDLWQLRDAVAGGENHVCVLRNYRKDGTHWSNELRVSAVHDDTGALTHYFGFQNDVTTRVEAELSVAHLAAHDQLTGLPNRARVLAGLQEQLLAADHSGSAVAVLFIDLDGFKDVNDTLGHDAGDLVLVATASRLRNSLRQGDLLGRYSGDEFLAVITDVDAGTASTIAQRVAASVLSSFETPFDVPGHQLRVGASIGVALHRTHGTDADALVQAADHAMYAAKHSGRGRAVVAGPGWATPDQQRRPHASP